MAITATNKLKVDSLVEDIFADQKVVAGLIPFEVARANDIDLMDLIAILRLWPRLLAPSQPWG